MNAELHPDISWGLSKAATLKGSLLVLQRALDNRFLSWAGEINAEEYQFPRLIAAAHLDKIDYFASFPHLATFAVTLGRDPENLAAIDTSAIQSAGAVGLPNLQPVTHVLTPAACYHVYPHFSGNSLERKLVVTTRNTCFRCESHYNPLRRQWSFEMREIVVLGNMEEVTSFIASFRTRLEAFFHSIGLPVGWEAATDPFFNPSSNPKYLAQKLDPVKTEMIYGGSLAIGSVNFHRNYFGEAFSIERDGEPAFTGCVAFGLERWLYAFIDHFGANPSDWPTL